MVQFLHSLFEVSVFVSLVETDSGEVCQLVDFGSETRWRVNGGGGEGVVPLLGHQ